MILFKILIKNFICLNLTRSSSKLTKTLELVNHKFKKMLMVRFENDNKVSISLKCQLTPTTEREFNLNRNKDEPIRATFSKLYSNYAKQMTNKTKQNKKLKKDETLEQKVENKSNVLLMKQDLITENNDDVPVFLYDLDNKLVPLDTKNEDAWKENFTFKLNEQEFKVLVNLPNVKKLNISKLLIAGMPALVKTEFEPEHLSGTIKSNSKYFWYYSSQKFEEKAEETLNKKKITYSTENIEWNLMNLENNGQNLKSCYLNEDHHNRLIKVVCIPNDSKRDGVAVEQISTTTVLKRIDLDKLPMTERHLETSSYLSSNK